jgi:hypothetical protein
MTSPGGKLTALACHPTKRVNKAEELTYLSTNNGCNQAMFISNEKSKKKVF